MLNTLTATTVDKLYDAWENGLDYVENESKLFVCYPDGIFIVPSDTVDLNNPTTRILVIKPGKPWGCKVE